ncbi:hypothetical protein DPMN_158712 [Dreissena polymorpha]|uniref:Uncharacterized protein n=1 Tax=Dreissena polymorpha TaxID=45954 RepID=A0A9D4EMZ2_DREPO|nr:hypothetical protein DPMN_158712 [Dreissena polymorpha]
MWMDMYSLCYVVAEPLSGAEEEEFVGCFTPVGQSWKAVSHLSSQGAEHPARAQAHPRRAGPSPPGPAYGPAQSPQPLKPPETSTIIHPLAARDNRSVKNLRLSNKVHAHMWLTNLFSACSLTKWQKHCHGYSN